MRRGLAAIFALFVAGMFITNAVYLKGEWSHPFKPERTKAEPFIRADGTKTDCPMMHTSEMYGFAENDGFKSISLAYKGANLSMLILLPDAVDGLRGLEGKLDAAMIERVMRAGRPTEVDVALPKFTMKQEIALEDALKKMGMVDVFDAQRADLSGITPVKPAWASGVKQDTFIAVDEKGTEAAAVMSVHMMLAAKPKRAEFRADHPFLYMIVDGRTKTVFLMGRVMDPTVR